MKNNNISKKINDSRMKIFMRDPFLGYILQHFDIIIDDSIETAQTDGRIISMGERFLEKLTEEEVTFVILHELLHIVLGHIERGKDLDQLRFNVACDVVVNDIIQSYDYDYGSLTPQFGKDYMIHSFDLSVEKVYELLPQNIHSIILDFHGLWPLIKNGDTDLETIIHKAIKKGYKSKSTDLQRRIENTYSSISGVKWNYILERYITKDLFDYTFNKVDYRYQNVLLPAFIESEETLKNIWLLVDVSRSIDDNLLHFMLIEIERIIRHFYKVSCDVSYFSTITTEPITFTDIYSLNETKKQLFSTGGTDYEQIFDSLEIYYKNNIPRLLIIFTDGYAKIPAIEKTKNIPIIWCTNNRDIVFPYGKTIWTNL